ncbi:hypothetical protein WSK_4119 [Novosphingobium sp. Rr 2-17]|uniref:hypothetical protein n=1 Tax=Novosphingobium sp. Rr 2-17 TaxID=555793 RepID=UPI000269A251|nr:hypothetical protein [Novosphingobium sp. Rr 2-17]EIZ77333.1 hypothetical protein WSK_4119 [Novosphingobium sp. Rr 2-17]
MSQSSSGDFWADSWNPWISAAFAPQKLWQSINSGWSFGNVTINEQNSSAPQTEQTILAHESYGRQIGKLLDAVSELVKTQPDRNANKAFVEISKLTERIDRIKYEAAVDRIQGLRRDLELLSASDRPEDQAAFNKSIEALRSLLKNVG